MSAPDGEAAQVARAVAEFELDRRDARHAAALLAGRGVARPGLQAAAGGEGAHACRHTHELASACACVVSRAAAAPPPLTRSRAAAGRSCSSATWCRRAATPSCTWANTKTRHEPSARTQRRTVRAAQLASRGPRSGAARLAWPPRAPGCVTASATRARHAAPPAAAALPAAVRARWGCSGRPARAPAAAVLPTSPTPPAARPRASRASPVAPTRPHRRGAAQPAAPAAR
jgi:hypothetical protein